MADLQSSPTPPTSNLAGVASVGSDERPWAGPPQRVLGQVVQMSAIVSNDVAAMVLAQAVAYPAGVMLPVQLLARRRGHTDADWGRITGLTPREAAEGGDTEGGDTAARVPASEGRPRFSVLGEGFEVVESRAETDGRDRDQDQKPADTEEQPSGPVLTGALAGGGGTYGDQEFREDYELWLWPLPSQIPLLLRVDWPDVGLFATIGLDGAAIGRAAVKARPADPD